MTGINLIIVKSSTGYDVTNLVESIQWRGRKGTPTRSINVSLLDDDGDGHARSEIDIEKGQHCIFSYNGQELFRGLIMSSKQNQDKKLSFMAYDNGIYLANNQDTFSYTNFTATEVFKDCCARFGIPYSQASSTSYRIPELTKPKTTAWDAIADALSLDFEAIGIRHFVTSDKGELKLTTRRENIMQWVIESGANLITYTHSNSIEKIKTRIKMVSKEGTTVAEKSNSALEGKIGVFQGIEKPDESLTSAQLQELVSTILEEQSTPDKTLEVEAIGIPEIMAGIGIFVIIPHLGLSRTFYVDEDNHSFNDQAYTMKLKLNFANDLERQPPQQKAPESSFSVGDIVNFAGGNHFVSSNATTPTGGTRRGGKAKLTLIAKGAKHPLHLIGGAYNDVPGDSNVYGWVNENLVSK